MENVKYVVLLYKYDVVEVDLFVILHIYNKMLSYKKKIEYRISHALPCSHLTSISAYL